MTATKFGHDDSILRRTLRRVVRVFIDRATRSRLILPVRNPLPRKAEVGSVINESWPKINEGRKVNEIYEYETELLFDKCYLCFTVSIQAFDFSFPFVARNSKSVSTAFQWNFPNGTRRPRTNFYRYERSAPRRPKYFGFGDGVSRELQRGKRGHKFVHPRRFARASIYRRRDPREIERGAISSADGYARRSRNRESE